MGYVHRDLKPDNIVLNLKPLEAVIIDFDRTVLDSDDFRGTVLGTQGYFPERDNLRDGSVKWDLWAYAAIVLEADMKEKKY
jgi:serine/threonine protein kinase